MVSVGAFCYSISLELRPRRQRSHTVAYRTNASACTRCRNTALTRAQRQRARHWALPTSGAHYTCVVGALVCCSHSPLQQKPGKPDLCCSLPPSPPSSPYLHHPQLTAAASHSLDSHRHTQQIFSVGEVVVSPQQIYRPSDRYVAQKLRGMRWWPRPR